MPLDDTRIRALLEATGATHDVEMDCEEFLGVMAEVAELSASGQPIPDRLRLAAEHIRLCANCHEELTAVTEVLGGQSPANQS